MNNLFYFKAISSNGTLNIHHLLSELKEAVKKSNTIQFAHKWLKLKNMINIKLIQLLVLVQNTYGVLRYINKYLRQILIQWCLEYYAKKRKSICKKSIWPLEQRSLTEFWEQQFSLHKSAFKGHHAKVLWAFRNNYFNNNAKNYKYYSRELLNKGYNPNKLDNDF